MYDRARLLQLIQPITSSPTDTVEFAKIPTGKHNRSYWVTTGDGTFVLRIAPPDDAGFLFYERQMMRQEPELHTLIKENIDIPVADVAAYDFDRCLIDRDYLLMTALPGKPLSDVQGLTQSELNRALFMVGIYLRRLHTLSSDVLWAKGEKKYGYLGAHRPMEPAADWCTAFGIMWNKLIDDVLECGTYTSEEALRMRILFDKFERFFQHSVEPILLHMDIWSQNILVDEESSVTGLVDFDRALWGDREIEFAVLDYCGISEPSFWEGYGETRDTSKEASIRRIFYLLYEVQKYMPIEVWRRNNRTMAEQYKKHSFKLASQLP